MTKNRTGNQAKSEAIAAKAIAGISPLSFVATRVESVQDKVNSLGSHEEKKAFFDHAFQLLEKKMPTGWASIYATIECCRINTWYWESTYESFTDFLRAQCSIAFEEFERLEKKYKFAEATNPSLFELDHKTAETIRKEVNKRQSISAGNQVVTKRNDSKDSIGDTKPTKAEILFTYDVDSRSKEFQDGFRSVGSTSPFYRFSRLKRDAPKVARDFVNGKYLEQRSNGHWFMNLKRAENDAARQYKAFQAKKSNKALKPTIKSAQQLIAKLSRDEFNRLVEWMNKQ